MCAYVHVCVCGRGGKGEVFHITHCLVCELEIMKLLHLSESPEVPLASVSYVCLPQQYIAHLQPNLAFLSDRLTSSSDLASYALSRSSSVQRSFFCGDVIAITSWAPDAVNLVRPISWRTVVRHM